MIMVKIDKKVSVGPRKDDPASDTTDGVSEIVGCGDTPDGEGRTRDGEGRTRDGDGADA